MFVQAPIRSLPAMPNRLNVLSHDELICIIPMSYVPLLFLGPIACGLNEDSVLAMATSKRFSTPK